MSESDYLVATVRERLAEGQAHELGIAVRVDDDRITVSGVVDTPNAHQRVLDVVTEIAPDLVLCDDLEIVDADREPRAERL